MTNVVFALLHVGLVWRYQVNISLSFEIQNIDLVLVSTAFQRLDLSEFEFLFQVCEYFHIARHLIKHWTKIMKSQNKKTTEDDGGLSLSPLQLDPNIPSSKVVTKPLLAVSQFKLLRGQLLLEEKMSAPRLAACCCTTSAFLLPASLSTKGSSFPGRYCDRLFSEFCGSSIYVCVYCLVMFYIWFFQFLLNCFLCFQTNAGITIKPWRGFSFGITTPTATRKA